MSGVHEAQQLGGRVRNTRQRGVVERIVLESERPLTIQEVLALARLAIPKLGSATVYRRLATLMAEGSVTPVQLPNDALRFESRTDQEHHYFRCRVCQRAFRVFGTTPEVERMRPPDFIVDAHAIFLYGRCADCGRTYNTSG
ncbi:MAG: transcriptional repressor [Bryobacterales bacterium]|nr:transcriptional repressor [Bryobacterales bacterium]